MRNFINLICVTFVLFAFTVHFASNPLTKFCCIHLNFTSVGRHHEDYQELLSFTQLLTPTHAQPQCHRLKFIKKPYKNSYMFRSKVNII